MTRRIVACGGQQLYHPALTRYVLELSERSHPKILFLPTASGEDPAYLLTFYQQLAGVDCAPTHLALFRRTVADVERLIRAQHVIMVGGGNTANMLAIWRLHGVEDALRKAYADGVILTGWSAGCICWFEAGITDSFTPELSPLRDGVSSWRAAPARTTTPRSAAGPSTRARSPRDCRPGSPWRTPSRPGLMTNASSRS